MIRKITVMNERALSFEFNEFKGDTPESNLEIAAKVFLEHEQFFHKAALIANHLKNFPEESVERAAKMYFGPDAVYQISKRRKDYRVYNIRGGLYIHEEDNKWQ